jgi:hypothetical protein
MRRATAIVSLARPLAAARERQRRVDTRKCSASGNCRPLPANDTRQLPALQRTFDFLTGEARMRYVSELQCA